MRILNWIKLNWIVTKIATLMCFTTFITLITFITFSFHRNSVSFWIMTYFVYYKNRWGSCEGVGFIGFVTILITILIILITDFLLRINFWKRAVT